jgi:hypothetical protein
MTRKTRTTTPSAVGLLIRFMLLVLAVIAAAVAAFAVDTVWALVAAIVVLVALLLEVVILISRYLRATGDQELVVDSEVAAAPSEPAVSVAVPETPPAGTRLLVLAGEAAPSIDEVPPSVRTLIAEADNVFVIAPTLPSRAQWLTSDVDRPRAEAKRRLDRVLSQLRGADVAAAGAVGDDTPLTTIGDGLLRFEPDHVVLALRSAEYAGWQERGLTEAIGEEIRVPLTAFAVAGAGRREAQPLGTAPAQ